MNNNDIVHNIELKLTGMTEDETNKYLESKGVKFNRISPEEAVSKKVKNNAIVKVVLSPKREFKKGSLFRGVKRNRIIAKTIK